MQYSDLKYLVSKRTVDDRALNHDVVQTVRKRVQGHGGPVRVLELGGGPGTMIDRLIEWQMLPQASYTILDMDDTYLASARAQVPRWAQSGVEVTVVHAKLEDWLREREQGPGFDLIIANAVLDLVDLKTTLPLLLCALEDEGIYWLTINFDGETILLPKVDNDDPIIAAYHQSMDDRVRDGKPIGDSRSGRNLLMELLSMGAQLLAAGSSDWVVFPQQGVYPAQEHYFLHHIVHSVEAELREHPVVGPDIPKWAQQRRAQIDAAELVYIAHQIDCVGTYRK